MGTCAARSLKLGRYLTKEFGGLENRCLERERSYQDWRIAGLDERKFLKSLKCGS